MIKGTKEYKGRNRPVSQSDGHVHVPSKIPEASLEPTPIPTVSAENTDLTNPSRREWFASLIPALGKGIVAGLRETNQIKNNLTDIVNKK